MKATDEVAVLAGAALGLVALAHGVEESSLPNIGDMVTGDLSGLDLIFLVVEGIDFAGHSFVVIFGVCTQMLAQPFAAIEGDSNDGPFITDLLVGLRDRGLDLSNAICVTGEIEAIDSAVREVFKDKPPVLAKGLALRLGDEPA